MKHAETRVHRAVTKILRHAQQGRHRMLVSGPTGIGLSYSASMFVEADPHTRVMVRAQAGRTDDVETALSKWLAPIATLIPGVGETPLGPKSNHLKWAVEDRMWRRSYSSEPLLIVIDQVEAFGTVLQLDRFARRLVEDLSALEAAIVLMGNDKLRLPDSNFHAPDEKTMVSETIVNHFDLFPLSMDQLDDEDLRMMAASKGATGPIAEIIARLCDKEVVPSSYDQIARAVRVLERHPEPDKLKLSEARRLLFG